MIKLLAFPLLFLSALATGFASKLEFQFPIPPADGNPFAREIWATVRKPSGQELRAPAYFVGGGQFAVRVFADEKGSYRLTSIEEKVGRDVVRHPATGVKPGGAEIDSPSKLRFVRIDARNPRRLSHEDGSAYVPFGGNLPWRPRGDPVAHYRERFQKFADAGLNWTRIWMCHWGGLNLDWLPGDDTKQLQPGQLDAGVAETWDRVIELAEESAVYVQVVLQHHGQYSSMVNPNWKENPWNAALPGGFLEKPGDFFTSEEARRLTRQKYRYIVARWGYSPAVLCWELFNEVHWVDPIRIDRDASTVAAWHHEMADHLRSVDIHRHLVTTSTDDVGSPIYERMDFLQPHIYARNMLLNMRRIEGGHDDIDRPVFFGEFGDDNMVQSEEQKRAGTALVPPVWSGLMGEIQLPPQPWYVDRLIDAGRFVEMEAVARFLAATRIAERENLAAFSPTVESEDRVPLVVEPGHGWGRRAEMTLDVPLDGSMPISLADVPGSLAGDPAQLDSGFAGKVTIRIHYPRSATAMVRFDGANFRGATAEVALDGKVVGTHTWPARERGTRPEETAPITFDVAAGNRSIVVRNAGGPDSLQFAGLDSGLEAPALAAVGKRGDDFIALWVWNRAGVFAVEPGDGTTGAILLDAVPAGSWQVEWWDSEKGAPALRKPLEHSGGALRLAIPSVARHAAVVLTR